MQSDLKRSNDNDWFKVYDEASQCYYFYNQLTKESTYETPLNFHSDYIDDTSSNDEDYNPILDNLMWSSERDELGEIYYYNSAIGTKQKEIPECFHQYLDENVDDITVKSNKTINTPDISAKYNLNIKPVELISQKATEEAFFKFVSAEVKEKSHIAASTKNSSSAPIASLLELVNFQDINHIDDAFNLKEILKDESIFDYAKVHCFDYLIKEHKSVNNLEFTFCWNYKAIESPLTNTCNTESEFFQDALVCNKLLLQYCGDVQLNLSQIQKVQIPFLMCSMLLKHKSDKFHDELLLQMIKQLIKNPTNNSLICCLQLLLVCFSSMIPSLKLLAAATSLLTSILCEIYDNELEDESDPSTCAEFNENKKFLLEACLKSMIRLLQIDRSSYFYRKHIPSIYEVHCALSNQTMKISIIMLIHDLDPIELDVNIFSTIRDVTKMIFQKLDVNLDSQDEILYDMFGLYFLSPKYLEVIEKKDEILLTSMNQLGYIRVIDLFSIHQIHIKPCSHFHLPLLFKIQFYLSMNPDLIKKYPIMYDLIYYQAYDTIVNQNKYPLTSNQAYELAAYHAYIHHMKSYQIIDKINVELLDSTVIHRKYISDSNTITAHECISKHYFELKKSKKHINDLQMEYIDKIYSYFKYFGSIDFSIEPIGNIIKTSSGNNDQCLSITASALILKTISSESCLRIFDFKSIIHWKYISDSNLFELTTGIVLKPENFHFKTKYGKQLCDTLLIFISTYRKANGIIY